MDQDEQALYGDLGDAKVTTTSAKQTSSTAASSRRPVSFAEQVEHLEAQVQQLTKENQTLKRNIGTLFRTARREMDRKGAQIKELQQALDSREGIDNR